MVVSLISISSFYNKSKNFSKFLLQIFTISNVSKKSVSQETCHANTKLNYHDECEKRINKQINLELYASYVYLGLAYYFNRSAISLPGFYKMFLFFSEEETEHARIFMSYQNLRGGKILITDIKAPQNIDWTPKSAVDAALKLERDVTSSILELHKCASDHNDPSVTNFLESIYIDEQYKAIDELYHLITKLNRVCDQEGLYILDKELEKQYKPVLKEKFI